MHKTFCLENLNGRDYSEDLGVEGKTVGRCGLDSSGSG